MKILFTRGPNESTFEISTTVGHVGHLMIRADKTSVSLGAVQLTAEEFENLVDQVTSEVRFLRSTRP